MSPVVSVCEVHGPFPSRVFRNFRSTAGELLGNAEPCPKCGRGSWVMDGTFHFDADGFAEALSAPQWSIDALSEVQGQLRHLESVLANPAISDEDAEAAVDRTVETLSDHDLAFADAVAARVKGRPRPKALGALVTILAILGGIATVRDSVEITTDIVKWVVEQVQEGNPIVGPKPTAPGAPTPEVKDS